MNYTVFRTKGIKLIGKILSTTVGPKPLNVTSQFLELECFAFRAYAFYHGIILKPCIGLTCTQIQKFQSYLLVS